jgi:hypothetical protein
MKYRLTFGITHWEVTQSVMATKLTRLTHKIAIQLHLVAESSTICSSRSRRPVRKLLGIPSYLTILSVSHPIRTNPVVTEEVYAFEGSHSRLRVTGWRIFHSKCLGLCTVHVLFCSKPRRRWGNVSVTFCCTSNLSWEQPHIVETDELLHCSCT